MESVLARLKKFNTPGWTVEDKGHTVTYAGRAGTGGITANGDGTLTATTTIGGRASSKVYKLPGSAINYVMNRCDRA